MRWRGLLLCMLIGTLPGPAIAHDVGFAEFVLQPLITLPSALVVVGTSLAIGLRSAPFRTIHLVTLLGAGLGVGLAWQFADRSLYVKSSLALALAAIAGGTTALAWRLPDFAATPLLMAAGTAVGAHMSPESFDWADLGTTFLGALTGSSFVLSAVGDTVRYATQPAHRIIVRIAGSWIFAAALMSFVLNLAPAGKHHQPGKEAIRSVL